MMAKRTLYIAAYDVSDPGRLRRALKAVKAYATGGQKSVFECFLTDAERDALLAEINGLLELDDDRFLLMRLEARGSVHTLGIAVRPVDPDYFYVG